MIVLNIKAVLASKYLQRYSLLKKAARKAAKDYANAYDDAHRITSCFGNERGGGSPSIDKMADAAVAMLEHSDHINVKSGEWNAAYEERQELVFKVADKNHLLGEVLQCVYIDGMTMKELGRYLERDRSHPYARSSLYRLRDKALERAYDIIEEEEKAKLIKIMESEPVQPEEDARPSD